MNTTNNINIYKQVLKLLSQKKIKQRTNQWYKERYNLLTASNVSAVIDKNPYLSKQKLFEKKTEKFCLSDAKKLGKNNVAINWGIKYEPIAQQIYQKMCNNNTKLYEFGIIKHPLYEWLGASPDGIISNGKMLEIKCVWKRIISDKILDYIWIQMQVQMEVCNLHTCDLFECKFLEYETKKDYLADNTTKWKGQLKYSGKNIYWKLDNYSIKTVERDKRWFSKTRPILEQFWNNVLKQRNKRKRCTPIHSVSSKKRKMYNINLSEYIIDKNVKNYILNDPLLDWLNIHGEKRYSKNKNKNDFNEFINLNTKKFKDAIYNNLKKRFPNDVKIITFSDISLRNNNYQKNIINTELAITNKVPIICNAVLHNSQLKMIGKVNILIRCDYLSKIIESNNRININTSINEYKIVKILFNTLNLKTDTNEIINNNNINVYKAEAVFTNRILEKNSNVKSDYIYFMGSRYLYKTAKEKKLYNNPFYTLGIFNVKTDINIKDKTNKAIEWLNKVHTYGHNWSLNPITISELYPNMCNKQDYPWYNVKKNIASDIGEITSLWNCGISERIKMHNIDIHNWQDNRFDVCKLWKSEKKQKILKKIIEINKNNTVHNINFNLKKLKEIMNKFDENIMIFYIDFETVNNIIIDKKMIDNIIKHKFNNIINVDKEFINIIGIGHIDRNTRKWIFKSFVADSLTINGERQMMDNFFKYINNFSNNNIKLCHWSQAEIVHINKVIRRHNNNESWKWITKSENWCDMLNIFKDAHIVVKGVFGFSLKDVSIGLYKLGEISVKWCDNNKCSDGMISMLISINCHEKSLKTGDKISEMEEMVDVVKYNEMDCLVLHEIFKFLKRQI